MTRHSTRGIRITEYGRWRDARRRLIERLGNGRYREASTPEIYVTPLRILTYFDPAYGTGALLSNPPYGKTG